MNVWVTSDQHFLHRNIIKYDKRPFMDEYGMNEFMLKRWNSLVKPGDKVYHLGDLFCGINNRWDCVVETIRKLNGDITLVKGNHDHSIEFYQKNGIEVIEGGYLIVNDILLSHYPIPSTPFDGKSTSRFKTHLKRVYHDNNCWFHFHGHTHSRPSKVPNAMNIACNLWDYKPILVLGLLD